MNRPDPAVASARARLLATARLLVGTRYENGVTVNSAEHLPTSIDCSGAMSWVCYRIYGGDGRLTKSRTSVITASGMFRHLDHIDKPQPADFAFYTLDGRNVSHVMMVTERNGVIGASDEDGRVAEYAVIAYMPSVTRRPSRWQLHGYRAFPLHS